MADGHGTRARVEYKIRCWCVYIHYRPNGSPFYVGKAVAYNGWRPHRARMFSERNPIHKKIVAKYGAENIGVAVIELPSELEAISAEIEHIARFRAEGHFLANLTEGGEGMSGYMPSDETRKKWSESRKGRKASAETRAKLSAVRIGKSINQPPRPWQAEITSKRFKGVPKSEEHKTKISAAHTGKIQAPASEETKAKMRAAQTERQTRPGAKEKATEAGHKAWATRRLRSATRNL
jgi:hypothetical protein